MNEEMIAKLKKAKSAEDVVTIAKEYGKELALEQAKALLDRVKGAELSDDALGAVAGGIIHDARARDPRLLGDPRLAGYYWHYSGAQEQTTVEDAADPQNW